MTYLAVCPGCRGEGRRAQPPYDVKHPERKVRWQAMAGCDGCDGTGYRPASMSQVSEHKQKALTDGHTEAALG